VYSSSRLVTLCLLSWVVQLREELEGCKVTQGLVRAEGVVGMLPGGEVLIQGGHLQVAIIQLISASGGLRMGPLGPLHAAIELRGAGRRSWQKWRRGWWRWPDRKV